MILATVTGVHESYSNCKLLYEMCAIEKVKARFSLENKMKNTQYILECPLLSSIHAIKMIFLLLNSSLSQ